MNKDLNEALAELSEFMAAVGRGVSALAKNPQVRSAAKQAAHAAVSHAARRIKKRFQAGGKKMIRTQKTSATDKRKSKQYYRRHKAQIGRHRTKVAKTSQFKRRQAFLARKHGESTDVRERMDALLEAKRRLKPLEDYFKPKPPKKPRIPAHEREPADADPQREINKVAKKARKGKLGMDDIAGMLDKLDW